MNDLDLVVAERAITRVLNRYAQGVDRYLLDQVRACYWDDATDSHLPHFEGPVDDYVDWLAVALPPLRCISHQLTNILIDVDEDAGEAAVESYCLNALVTEAATAPTLQCFRYVDRFQRRDGEWRILRRTVARDWEWAVPTGEQARGAAGRQGMT